MSGCFLNLRSLLYGAYAGKVFRSVDGSLGIFVNDEMVNFGGFDAENMRLLILIMFLLLNFGNQ